MPMWGAGLQWVPHRVPAVYGHLLWKSGECGGHWLTKHSTKNVLNQNVGLLYSYTYLSKPNQNHHRLVFWIHRISNQSFPYKFNDWVLEVVSTFPCSLGVCSDHFWQQHFKCTVESLADDFASKLVQCHRVCSRYQSFWKVVLCTTAELNR